MKSKFEVLFLEEARGFLKILDDKERVKILLNIDKAKITNDPELFKKLTDTIWEFRTFFKRKKYRLLAFWDKEDKNNTLVIATHGIIKKKDEVPKKEIDKAENIRKIYFNQK
jgi:mRNA-degrading endonuclease RelE of RelBE toxin-antitoxin system